MEVKVPGQSRDNEDDLEPDFFGMQDDDDLEDRLGKIEQQMVDGEFVLTRVPREKPEKRHEVLRYVVDEQLLRIFPRSTSFGELVPQFEQNTEIQVESPGWDSSWHSAEHGRYWLLYAKGLPKGFSAIYEFGLGIQRDYRHFVDEILERSASSTVRFVIDGPEGPDPASSIFRVSLTRFEQYRSAVDRSRSRAQTAARRVIDADTHNAVADLFGAALVGPKYTRNPAIRAITEEVATGHVTDANDRALIADELTAIAPVIAAETPGRLVQLRDDIELVSLQSLIERFSDDLDGPHSNDEGHWQDFFAANKFALQLLFAAPVVVVREHATVQAPDIDGRGSRITDFLCANTVTRTVSVVEIKTPASRLMSASAYRGSNSEAAVYAPHSALAGAIAQLQSQMASVPRSLAGRLTPELNLDPWNEPCGALVVGRVSSLEPEQRESFLRYRAGLSNITVLGYDEVLERLKALRDVLASPTTIEQVEASTPSTA